MPVSKRNFCSLQICTNNLWLSHASKLLGIAMWVSLFKYWLNYLKQQLVLTSSQARQQDLVGLYRTHHDHRRLTKEYQLRQQCVSKLWLLMLLPLGAVPSLALLAVLVLLGSFLSFCILDEARS